MPWEKARAKNHPHKCRDQGISGGSATQVHQSKTPADKTAELRGVAHDGVAEWYA